jgi:hypothetical protein
LANFLFISPNQTKFSPLFAYSQLDISDISDSVSAVSEGFQLNYCWILKLLSRHRIFKLLNFYGNQLISIPLLLMSLFLLFLGKIFQQLNLDDSSRNCLLEQENSQIFKEDFYLPLYLPLCLRRSTPFNENYPER